ncbi:MAG TPA: CDP-alcohol phosphatidyltransferase family protein [bacterium]|nr:CDP-alcohol phosphatidyltransferase family protein [bacterium]
MSSSIVDEKAFSEHRVQTSFLANPERKALVWIAQRIPRWISPDMLTFFGLFGMVWVGLSYYLAHMHWLFLVSASLGHIMNWAGDSLDGSLARARNQQRPRFGYYFDHLIDAFGIAFMLYGMAYSHLVKEYLVWPVLTMFFIAHINTYLVTNTRGLFKISYLRISTTEARVAMIILNTVLIFVNDIRIFGIHCTLVDIIAVFTSLFLLVAVIRSAYINLSALDKEERAKWKS